MSAAVDVCRMCGVQVRQKPVLPEQNNDNIDDEVAADIVWKQSRHREDSIIVDLFCVSASLTASSVVVCMVLLLSSSC